MFSSLASFLFGSNTSATTTNSEENLNQSTEEEQQRQQQANNLNETQERIDAEHTIEVTSSTPSVTGATSSALGASTLGLRQGSKRSKNKRNKQIQKSKRQGFNASAGAGPRKHPTNLAKLLTPNDSLDEDIDEDDWYIVEKEDEEESLPRTDSEEEISVTEVKPKLPTGPAPTSTALQRRRVVHINSHSLYSGPRPQQQRNSLQRARQNGARLIVPANIPILSPQLNNLGGLTATSATIRNGLADLGGGMTQSLYVASTSAAAVAGQQQQHQSRIQHNESHLGANCSMDESWYVTPPPCFTSIGPIDMETSPFENLLIEHPSMSVYHSIRSAQEATESFVNLDLGVNETQTNSQNAGAAPSANEQQQDQVEERSGGRARIDRQSAAQLKQELLARTNQKNRDRQERQKLCRGALKRANAVRDYQSKGNRQRRSDMQHCKINSGANNNRKCCF